MADKKTSQEVDGTTFQKTDLTRIARGGSNYKLTAEQVFSETITLGDFGLLMSNNDLINERTYKVTDALSNGTDIIYVTAYGNNSYHQEIEFQSITSSPLGIAKGWIDDLTSMPYSATDLYGNFYLQPYVGGTLPNFGTGYFYGCYFDGTDGSLIIINPNNTIFNTEFKGGNYNVFGLYGQKNIFVRSTIANANGCNSEFSNLRLYNSAIYNNVGASEYLNIQNSECINSTITFSGNDAISVANCKFQNCVVEIKNGAIVDGLTIIGTDEASGNYPYYIIDGAYQNKVIANWSGTVISGINGNGSSTVRAKLFYEPFTGNQGTYDENGTVYLINYSPIGIYEFNEYTVDTSITISITAINSASLQRNHKIKFKWFENANTNTIQFQMANSVTGIFNNDEIVKYHGITVKVGQILTVNSYFEVFSMFEPINWGGDIWFANWGVHYDI